MTNFLLFVSHTTTNHSLVNKNLALNIIMGYLLRQVINKIRKCIRKNNDIKKINNNIESLFSVKYDHLVGELFTHYSYSV